MRRWLAQRLLRGIYPDAHALRRACPGVQFHDSVSLRGLLANVAIGPGSFVGAHVEFHGGGYEWSGGEGCIRIGAHAAIMHGVTVWGAGPGIVAGERLALGPGVVLVSSATRYVGEEVAYTFGPIRIGDRVEIFSNATVGPGVTIGDGARVGAGAVVTKDVPAGALVVGVPARVVG